MFKGLFGRRGVVPATGGVELREESDSPPPQELDLTADFRIVMPVIVSVPISPLETFSDRAIKEYDKQQAILRKKVRGSIFQPQPNGKLKIYPVIEGEKKQ